MQIIEVDRHKGESDNLTALPKADTESTARCQEYGGFDTLNGLSALVSGPMQLNGAFFEEAQYGFFTDRHELPRSTDGIFTVIRSEQLQMARLANPTPIGEIPVKTVSASRVEAVSVKQNPGKIMVWDAPVRVFHWLLVISFAGAYLTAESEQWRLLHVTLGYTMAGLVTFRILWGVVGSRYARFSSFVRGPAAVVRYVRALMRGQPEHYAGHNPLGALAIIALLGLAIVVTASGWSIYSDTGGEWLEEAHELASNVMLAVVGLHVAGVIGGSWVHHENLIGAMFSGRKLGPPEDGIRSAWKSVAILMMLAVLGYWWLQWRSAPVFP